MTSAKRRLAVAVLAAGLTAAVTMAGCGVPGNSGPVVVGAAPKAGTESEASTEQPPAPEGASSAADLVDRFLQAAAWGNDPDASDEAETRVRRFLTPAALPAWARGTEPGLTIVHPVWSGQSVGRTGKVTMSLQPIGILNSQGTIDPVVAEPQPVEFTVQPSTDGQQLRIDGPLPSLRANGSTVQLPRMLLSDEHLDTWYEPRPIYFWSRSQRENVLVPDLRYLAKSVPLASRPFVILNWLRGGPSRWLLPVADPVPGEIVSKDKPVLTPSTLTVNLSANADGVLPIALARYVAQLRWSLYVYPNSANVQLQVEGQTRQVDGSSGNGYLAYNPAAASATDTEPEEYCVVDGRVRQIGSDNPLPPVLAGSTNTDVLSAAMPRAKPSQAAALVKRHGASGPVQLFIGQYDKKLQAPRYGNAVLIAARMSRPQWLASPSPRVFVVADGRLRQFVAGQQQEPSVEAAPGPITAFAVAPDGHRIAMIVGDRVLVATLGFDDDGNRATVGPPQAVRTGLVASTGVGWGHEERLVVAGRDANGPALAEVTVDGALVKAEPLSGLNQLNITAMAVYTQRPGVAERLSILIQAGDKPSDKVYKVFSSGSVFDLTEAALPPASPSASPSRAPVSVAAPFFLD
jgi:hypothetical protein